jgi:uncharacterized protein YkwD
MQKILAMLACAGLMSFPGPAEARTCHSPEGAGRIEAALVGWINDERAKKGLPALAPVKTLDAAAGRHACAMAGQGKLSHQNFAGRLHGAGYFAGVENVARSSETSAAAAARIWKKSGAHWANLLNRDIRTLGIGTAMADGRTYYVFMAGAP